MPLLSSGASPLAEKACLVSAAKAGRNGDMTGFIFAVISGILGLLVFAIIASAILSWLVAFNVINIRHPVAQSVVGGLDAITRPVLRPFQRFIPPLGGMDLSPIAAIIVIQAARQYLLPWLFAPLFRLIG